MNALKSKYRVRFRKAVSKGSPISRKILSADEVETEQHKIFNLYREVVKNADFHMVDLKPSYFPLLKANLKGRFTIAGYYLDNELIGFMSHLDNGKKLEAHFTGFHVDINKKYDLYLNMLLHLIQEALLLKKDYLVLSRTALEIKSSVGAIPVPLVGFLKHSHSGLNHMFPTLFQYFYKNEDWIQRKPFKDRSLIGIRV
jgi:hypothetical protein